jgi:tetratricopeptide (TPR) repeat protein
MLRRWLLGVTALLLAGGSMLLTADEVHIRGKDKSIKGTIKTENPSEIVINLKDVFPASDIVDVEYIPEPITAKLAYAQAVATEKASLDPTKEASRKSLLADALKKYEDVLPTIVVSKQSPFAKRQVEYKIAMLRVRQAQEDGEALDKAIAKLKAFTKSNFNRSGWQITSVLKTLARLQLETADFDGAEESYTRIAEMEALSEDVRQDARLSVIQVKLQAGKYEDARAKLKELQNDLKPGNRFYARAKVAEAECLVAETKKFKAKDDPGRAKLFGQAVDLVRGVIKESNDKYVKAVGHNTLGFCYMEQGQPKEAVWEFLWVDVVYNQDRAQHAKALYHLWDLFTKEGDAPRAQESRELLMSPQFAGTEGQRLLKEAKTP